MFDFFVIFLIFLLLIILFSSLITVQQGTIAVITIFGKYQRVLHPGLRLKIPIIEAVFRRVSIQNRSIK